MWFQLTAQSESILFSTSEEEQLEELEEQLEQLEELEEQLEQLEEQLDLEKKN